MSMNDITNAVNMLGNQTRLQKQQQMTELSQGWESDAWGNMTMKQGGIASLTEKNQVEALQNQLTTLKAQTKALASVNNANTLKDFYQSWQSGDYVGASRYLKNNPDLNNKLSNNAFNMVSVRPLNLAYDEEMMEQEGMMPQHFKGQNTPAFKATQRNYAVVTGIDGKERIEDMNKFAKRVGMKNYMNTAERESAVKNYMASTAIMKAGRPESEAQETTRVSGDQVNALAMEEKLSKISSIVQSGGSTQEINDVLTDVTSKDTAATGLLGAQEALTWCKVAGGCGGSTTDEDKTRYMQMLKAYKLKNEIPEGASLTREQGIEFGTMALTTISEGSSARAGDVDKGQVVAAQNLGASLLSGKYKGTYAARQHAQENYLDSNAYKNNKGIRTKHASVIDMDTTVKAIDRLDAKFKEAVKTGEYKSGFFDSTMNYLSKITPEKFAHLTGMSADQIMGTLGLQGEIGMEFALYLKSMSGTAAAQSEVDRTIDYIIGSAFVQEGAQAKKLTTFKDSLRARHKDASEYLITEGLTGTVYTNYEKTYGTPAAQQLEAAKAELAKRKGR